MKPRQDDGVDVGEDRNEEVSQIKCSVKFTQNRWLDGSVKKEHS